MKHLLHKATCVAFMIFTAGAAPSEVRVVSHLPKLAWTCDYAIPYTTAKDSLVQAKIRQQMNLAAPFLPMLRVAFPQRQWFWGARGKYKSVAEVAQEFLGVPGRSWDRGASAWIDDDRYVTEEGCVPHDCVDRGMLWIDTAPTSPAVIFVAADSVSFTESGTTHLWVFVSNSAMGATLPPAFKRSASRWNDSNQAEGYMQRPLLATLVFPDGGMRDIATEEFFGKPFTPGAAK